MQIFSAAKFSLNPRLTKLGQFSVCTRPGGVELKQDQESKISGQFVVFVVVLPELGECIISAFSKNVLPGGKSCHAFRETVAEVIR